MKKKSRSQTDLRNNMKISTELFLFGKILEKYTKDILLYSLQRILNSFTNIDVDLTYVFILSS